MEGNGNKGFNTNTRDNGGVTGLGENPLLWWAQGWEEPGAGHGPWQHSSGPSMTVPWPEMFQEE